MATLGRVVTAPALQVVNSTGNNPLTDGWEVVLRIPGADLPGTATSDNYVFVVTGEVGDFIRPRDTGGALMDATAEIMVVQEGTLSSTYRHVVNLNDANLLAADPRATPTLRSHPFQIIYPGSSWSTSKNLVVLGRVYVRGLLTFQAPPSFVVSSLAVQAWDTTVLGSGRFFFDVNGHSPAANLDIRTGASTPATGTELMTPTNPIPYSGTGAKKWLVYHSVAVVPGTRSGSHTTYTMRLPLGSWGTADEAWGYGDNGTPSIGPNTGVAEFGTYHIGGARVYDIASNTTKIGIRGLSQYPASETRAQALRTTLFCVKIDEAYGFDYEETANNDLFYGTTLEPQETEVEFNLNAAVPFNVLSVAVPKNGTTPQRGVSFRSALRYNGRAQGDHGLSVYCHTSVSGPPHMRVATVQGAKLLNVFSTLRQQNPGEPQNEIRVGPTIALALPGVANSTTIRLTTASPHGLINGDRAVVEGILVQVNGGSPIPYVGNGSWTITRITDTIVELVGATPAVGTVTHIAGGTIIKLAQSAQPGKWITMIGWAMTDAAPTGEIPSQVEGPEVEILPGTEALGLGSLTALPVLPSWAIQADVESQRVDLVSIAGYRVTWPKLLTPRRTLNLTWRGITRTQLETLIAFFQGISNLAFKWQQPGDIERPYVLASFDLTGVDETKQIHTVSATVIELVFVG